MARWSHTQYPIIWLAMSTAVLSIKMTRNPLVLVALLPVAGPLLGTYDLWPILAMVFAYLTVDENPRLSWFLLGSPSP